ncbi:MULTISPECIES: phage tail-collar fiber domain-containing protein [Serratia]|uniref:phage tail-collar fiber domain-containing protein n=1 Tax=Serratia TaxID=613 RepID=UPI000CF6DFBF|nr:MULTISPECIES: phage tail protein [Serratia]AVJ18323.1 hypothetical protein CLM71_14845 [Serratia sp. MYb239]MEB6337881.1 phage tail protein [Serratia rhizosphaerae]
MSAIITRKYEQWAASQTAQKLPARPDTFVFAYIPDQDPETEISRDEPMPAQANIVHTAPVMQYGMLNGNAVVFSVVLDTTVGDFNYNWIGLLDQDSGTLCMIVHTRTQRKIATSGQAQGNTLTRTLAMEFDGAAGTTQINVTAQTWQIDFSARLSGIDERQRLANIDVYGVGAFFGDAFLVTHSNGAYQAAAGVGYVGGVRAELPANVSIDIGSAPTLVWADVSLQGQVTSRWEAAVTFTVADELQNYTDAQGFTHYVTQLARINEDGSVTDLRRTGAIDDRYVKKAGDTMTGPLTLKSTIAADYYGTTTGITPVGSGPYDNQLESKAQFYQDWFEWDPTSGGHYVPLVKGKGTRKEKGWPTAVSFGYLLPGEDVHAHPIIHAAGDGGAECVWEFDTQSGGILSKLGSFCTEDYAQNRAKDAENEAKAYADQKAASAESSAKTYAEQQAANAQSNAQNYAATEDQKIRDWAEGRFAQQLRLGANVRFGGHDGDVLAPAGYVVTGLGDFGASDGYGYAAPLQYLIGGNWITMGV